MSEDMEKLCSNCGEPMCYLGDEKIQLGQVGLLLGHLSNLWHGSLYVELWECPTCGKLDFYRGEGPAEEAGHMAQTVCPRCGAEHDLDDPKCPRCGAKNPNI